MKAPRTHALSDQLQAAKVRDKLAFSHMFDHACELEDELKTSQGACELFAAEQASYQKEIADLKSIAYKLMRQCEFALGRLKADGWTGELLDTSGGKYTSRHWKEEMADTMELIPGVKVNREAMYETRKKAKK